MKYYDLIQIADFLSSFSKIKNIARAYERVIEIEFKNHQKTKKLFFDLNPNHSAIYSASELNHSFNAPFDLALKKYFVGANIKKISVLPNNRVLKIDCVLQKSYKNYEISIVFEFTGKNTNAILLQENMIISALKYVVKSVRKTMPNTPYEELPSYEIKEKEQVKINDFNVYFDKKANEILSKKIEQKRASKLIQADKKIERLKDLLKKLEDPKNLEEKAAILQKKADVLSIHLHEIKPYLREFSLLDFDGKKYEYFLENPPKIALNEMYKNAKKLRAKAKNGKIEMDLISQKINTLNNTKILISSTKNEIFLDSIFHKKAKNQSKDEKNNGVINFYLDDYKISVGTNEKANEWLLKNSKKDDFWFHAKDRKSAHVIVRSNKTTMDYDTLEYIAILCARYSNFSNGDYLIDFTKRQNVKVRDGAFVNYIKYDTIKINLSTQL